MVTKRPEKRSSLVSRLCKRLFSKINSQTNSTILSFYRKTLPGLPLVCVQGLGEGCRCTFWFVSALNPLCLWSGSIFFSWTFWLGFLFSLFDLDWVWFLVSLWSGFRILCFLCFFCLCLSVWVQVILSFYKVRCTYISLNLCFLVEFDFSNLPVSCCWCCNCCYWSAFWCFDSQFMFPVNAFPEGFIRGLFFTEKGLFTVYVSGSDFTEGLLSSLFSFLCRFSFFL